MDALQTGGAAIPLWAARPLPEDGAEEFLVIIYVPLGCPKTEVLTAPKRLQLREHPRVLHPRSVRCQFYSASEALG